MTIDESTLKYYTVTREQEVKISATSPLEAATLAQAAFDGDIKTGDLSQGRVTKAVRQRTINVMEDY